MKRIALIGLLALAGCDKPMTNQQVAEAVKFCRDHNLEAHEFSGWTFETVSIQCQQLISR